jgi:hypothetical protein
MNKYTETESDTDTDTDTLDKKITTSEAFKAAEKQGTSSAVETWPKTLVLSISTHGYIVYEKPSYDLPEDLIVVKMNSVIPSVCNFILGENLKKINDFITQKIDEIPALNSTNLVNFCSEIRDRVISEASESEQGIFADTIEKKKKGSTEDLDIQLPFLHSFDKGYAIINATNSSITNKMYSRENSIAVNGFGDWQIKALNLPGQPDLMSQIELENGRRTGRSGEAVTDLKEIITFCIKKGSNRILIFDFSCANVTDKDRKDVFKIDRDRRMYANEMLKSGKWGGQIIKAKKTKKRVKKHQKKTRKYKKSRNHRKNRK